MDLFAAGVQNRLIGQAAGARLVDWQGFYALRNLKMFNAFDLCVGEHGRAFEAWKVT